MPRSAYNCLSDGKSAPPAHRRAGKGQRDPHLIRLVQDHLQVIRRPGIGRAAHVLAARLATRSGRRAGQHRGPPTAARPALEDHSSQAFQVLAETVLHHVALPIAHGMQEPAHPAPVRAERRPARRSARGSGTHSAGFMHRQPSQRADFLGLPRHQLGLAHMHRQPPPTRSSDATAAMPVRRQLRVQLRQLVRGAFCLAPAASPARVVMFADFSSSISSATVSRRRVAPHVAEAFPALLGLPR